MGFIRKTYRKVKKAVKKTVKKIKEAIFGKPPSPVNVDTSKYEEPTFSDLGSAGILVTSTGSNSAIPVIYGKTRTGGTQVFIKAEGNYTPSGAAQINNAFLHLAIVICEGEINNVNKIYFDDVLAATNQSSSGNSDSWTIASPWTDYVTVNFRAGSDSQTSISALQSQMGNNPHFKGIAYVYLKLKYHSDVWKNGMPSITFEVEGKKVPATSDGTSLSYSENPARCILDYLTNTRYGKGIPVSQIDLTSFASAESHFDTSGVNFHCRGNLFTGVNMYDNTIDLMTSCNSSLALGDKYRLVPEKSGTSVMDLNDSNTIGSISYQLASKGGLLNSVKVKFMDETTEYKDNINVLENSTLKTQDNGNLLQSELYLPFTKTSTIANRLATHRLNQSRQSHMISLKATIEAIKLTPGDVVRVTNETFRITNKLFRVVETQVLPQSEIELVLKEYDDGVYSDSIITDARNDDND